MSADLSATLEAFCSRVETQSRVASRYRFTRLITCFVVRRGRTLGYHVEREAHVGGGRCDVLWSRAGERVVMWEVDSSNRERSLEKLRSRPARVNLWVLWAKEANQNLVDDFNALPGCAVVRPREAVIGRMFRCIAAYNRWRRAAPGSLSYYRGRYRMNRHEVPFPIDQLRV